MIRTGGAIGDNFYAFPAVAELRKEFDEIYMCGKEACRTAFEGTEYVDKFIIKPPDFYEWGKDLSRQWLATQVDGLDFSEVRDTFGAVPGRYVFLEADAKYDSPTQWKREQNEGVNYFDATSIKLGAPGAVGKRPVMPISHNEHGWLRDFRFQHKIPKKAFILAWQFTGSSTVKWYPHFDRVIQKSIMQDYPDVYVVALGDMKGRLDWDRKYHHGRYINLKDTVSFRQAALLISISDLLVSPDTGMYCASQCFPQTPKILLASLTDGKAVTYGLGQESTIIQSEAACSPCYRICDTCLEVAGDYGWDRSVFCMHEIPPVKVIGAIKDVLRQRGVVSIRKNVQIGKVA